VSDAQPLVFVVDDDDSFRHSTERLIRLAGFDVSGFPSAQAFLEAERPDVPCCVVLDLLMPGVSGLELQSVLAGQGIEVIFMTGHGDIPTSVRAMKAGAVEFLTKPFADEALIRAIVTALERSTESRNLRREHAEARSRYATLTRREREVLAHLVRGLLNKQIAADLGISEITVKIHRRNVLSKMGASSLAELVRLWERHQLWRVLH
jgi:FixJ family two-component response regulator